MRLMAFYFRYKQFKILQSIILALSAFCLIAFSAGQAKGADEAEVAGLLRQCATELRAVRADVADFPTPPDCEKAAKNFVVDTADGQKKLDFTWIADDIDTIRETFKNNCIPCKRTMRAAPKKKKTRKDDKKQVEGPVEDDEAACAACDDPLADFTTAGDARNRLADNIEYAASSHERPLADGDLGAFRDRAKKILSDEKYKYKEDEKKAGDEKESIIVKKLREWFRGKEPQGKNPNKNEGTDAGTAPALPLEALQAALVVAGLFLLALIVALLFIRFRRLLKEDGPDDAEAGGVAAEKASTPAQHTSEAEALRGRGEYRLAMRSLFLAFLRSLEQKGLVVFIRNKTNREYLNELKKKKPVGPSVEKLNVMFEQTWYGMKDCDENDYVEFREVYESSKKEV